jgi:hypothetical protein
LKLSKIETTIYTEPTLTPPYKRRNVWTKEQIAMPTYKDITIQLVLNTTKRVDVLAKELVIQSKSLDYILKLAKEKISYCLPFLPFNLSGTKTYGSGFGYRTDPFTKARKMHEGMDFTAK